MTLVKLQEIADRFKVAMDAPDAIIREWTGTENNLYGVASAQFHGGGAIQSCSDVATVLNALPELLGDLASTEVGSATEHRAAAERLLASLSADDPIPVGTFAVLQSIAHSLLAQSEEDAGLAELRRRDELAQAVVDLGEAMVDLAMRVEPQMANQRKAREEEKAGNPTISKATAAMRVRDTLIRITHLAAKFYPAVAAWKEAQP